MFTGDRRRMGQFVNPRWIQALAWFAAALIVVLNAWLLIQTATGR
jgi:manganese transport protein